ncbi:hypothetical protein HMPREF9628_01308 [Peptoanaerobacter stomatis]|uniref:Phage head morphogenesis domain-containing protein n=1 Tax=Peptoanaerobacter stomatis TaxID=796937 RepID=G9XBE1_9FIRM|nr:minor capsid protein [Peptoanaerobacter stomatis]EHL19792.1 hypothetical protein HMPREF9628_01308 [Peptoanaerobacter stomatis]
MNNRDYWIKRALMQEQKTKEKSEKFLNDLQKQYNTAFMEIETDIQNWYKKYAKENNISILEAKKILSEKETKDYILDIETSIAMIKDEDLKLYLRKKYFQERITRLQSLKNQTAMELEILRQSQDISTFEHLKNVYMDNLTVDPAITVSSAFHRFSRVAVENAVLTNWSGDTFSNRIWKHSNKLIDECQNVITTGIIQGHSIDTMSKKLSKRMDSNFANAKRIVRTESNYILSRATFENYETMGVEQYEFLATLDYKTSEICRELDKKVFYVKDKQVGVNCNPMHPNCRSTTIPYFSDMQGSRATRGVDGKTYSVDRNMSYRDWYNSLSEEEKKQMEILAKMDKNKVKDKEQYEKIKGVLGKNAPKNLEEFQKVKYTDNNRWGLFKSYKKSIEIGEISPLASFNLYENVSKEIDEKLIGISTVNGINVVGRSNHFVSRVIGSTEERRNGIDIDKIFDALTNKETNILELKKFKNGTSQKFRYNGVEVSVNPTTGNLIQTNPTERK